MTTSQQRSALASLDQARPAIARLDISRDPEDIAADIIEGWQAAETALRTLIGSATMSGQPLIREVRQREMLTLDQAHALVEFSAAHERAQRTEYRPTSADIAAARTGFQQLEAALRQERVAPPPPATAGVASAVPAADVPAEPVAVRRRGFPLILLLAILLVLGGLGTGIYYVMTRQSNAALQRGIQAYTSGNRTEARNAFAEAVRDDPNDADPHIYLARMAREEGDAQNAVRELETAIKLEPTNSLAQREMGAHLLTKSTAELNSGNLPAALQSIDLARRFFARAVEYDPNDRVAMGWLGCSLMRLGRVPEAQRFYSRAGPGDWSRCTPLPTLAPQPGMAAPVR
ncbi:MAG TPA: tetratricopeptide repeat protein [Gemmatimonadaceae bacterium]|nr:tetratricopeptide repeat protein [Gemmatimonadaceae bacterium]